MVCGENQTCQIIFEYVFPTFGNITALVLFLSPFPAVYGMRKWLDNQYQPLNKLSENNTKKISSSQEPVMINSLPYAWQLNNCFAFLLYGYVIRNYFVGVCNLLGVSLSLYYIYVLNSYGTYLVYRRPSDEEITLDEYQKSQHAESKSENSSVKSASLLSSDKIRRQNIWSLWSLLFGASVIFPVVLVVFASVPDQSSRQLISGILAIAFNAMFMASPLSALWTILETRDGRHIYLPLSFTGLLNASFWSVYGFILTDPFIYGPNMFGVLVTLVQIALSFLRPLGSRSRQVSD